MTLAQPVAIGVAFAREARNVVEFAAAELESG
jgi:hypothetical protein